MRLSRQLVLNRLGWCALYSLAFLTIVPLSTAQGLVSSDLSRLRNVGSVAISPDAHRVAYTVVMRDRPGRPYGQLWIMELATQKSVRVGGEKDSGGGPLWSPDGKWLAFQGSQGDKHGLFMSRPDGSDITFLAPLHDSNSPLPGTGKDVTWSPDGKELAFISSTPGAEAAEASGDPMVITRYLYKPDAGEGMTRFNGNQRLHIFAMDMATKQIRQLTQGNTDEHSIDWSPDGKEILFASNREPNQDEFFNYDLFTLRVADSSIRRLTATEYNEYDPLWSPDGKHHVYRGTRRGLTDRETTMEDTHVWVMNADGSDRREVGAVVDNRQGTPRWAPDGRFVYFTVQERGSNYLMRLPISAGKPEYVVKETGSVGNWSLGKNGALAYGFASPRDAAELYLKSGDDAARKLTDLNSQLFAGKQIAEVESFSIIGNDNKFEVEAFLTKPLGMTATSKHPLIVNIHGGPHGQNGPAFNIKSQVYAAHGYAVLNVNYRGSTGYGQKFADAVFGDQNGNEAQDVLYGVSAAVRRNLWINRERLGLSEVKHVIDSIDRSIAWYEKHFPKPGAEGITNVQP